jgi:hypothetical protein
VRQLVAAFLLLLSVEGIRAQSGSHLNCYKIKDPQAKTSYTATLGGLTTHPGCIVKLPAKFACVPADETNVDPPATGGGTQTANAFACYNVKCPKTSLPPLQLDDQFGSRLVSPSAPKMLCAPLAPPTTTSTTVTTTTGISTTTTVPTCANGGIPCGDACGGGCGVCLGNAGSCPFVHCGSMQPVCANIGTLSDCSIDDNCAVGAVCMAAANFCGSGMFSSCGAICPE